MTIMKKPPNWHREMERLRSYVTYGGRSTRS